MFQYFFLSPLHNYTLDRKGFQSYSYSSEIAEYQFLIRSDKKQISLSFCQISSEKTKYFVMMSSSDSFTNSKLRIYNLIGETEFVYLFLFTFNVKQHSISLKKLVKTCGKPIIWQNCRLSFLGRFFLVTNYSKINRMTHMWLANKSSKWWKQRKSSF